MTKTELRELDAWIAEHVMGWTDIEQNPFSPNPHWCGFNKSQGKTSDANKGSKWGIGNYTTDPAAAMEVLEKCTDKLGMFEHISINHAEGEFAIRMAHAGWDWIWAETLPLAICLFAKKLFTKD